VESRLRLSAPGNDGAEDAGRSIRRRPRLARQSGERGGEQPLDCGPESTPMTDELNESLFDAATKVVKALKPLPDDEARRRVIRAAAILLQVNLDAVGLQEIER